MVTITDAPPAFDAKAMVEPTSTRNACDLNTAGDVVTLGLAGGSVADPDAAPHNVGCAPSETLTYTWRISDWPGGATPVLTAYDGSGCAAPTAGSGHTLAVPSASAQVCLWTDPTLGRRHRDVQRRPRRLRRHDDRDQPRRRRARRRRRAAVHHRHQPRRRQLRRRPHPAPGVRRRRRPRRSRRLRRPRPQLRVERLARRPTDLARRCRAGPCRPTSSTCRASASARRCACASRRVDRTGELVPPAVCAPDADDCVVHSCASLARTFATSGRHGTSSCAERSRWRWRSAGCGDDTNSTAPRTWASARAATWPRPAAPLVHANAVDPATGRDDHRAPARLTAVANVSGVFGPHWTLTRAGDSTSVTPTATDSTGLRVQYDVTRAGHLDVHGHLRLGAVRGASDRSRSATRSACRSSIASACCRPRPAASRSPRPPSPSPAACRFCAEPHRSTRAPPSAASCARAASASPARCGSSPTTGPTPSGSPAPTAASRSRCRRRATTRRF